jgi:hypothetical protein
VSLYVACASPTLIYCDAYRSLLRIICSCTAPRERNFAPRHGHPPRYARLPLGHGPPCPLHIFRTMPPFTPYLSSSSIALQLPTPQFYYPPTPPLVCCTHRFSFLSPSKPCSFTLVFAKARTTHVTLQYEGDGGKVNGDEWE